MDELLKEWRLFLEENGWRYCSERTENGITKLFFTDKNINLTGLFYKEGSPADAENGSICFYQKSIPVIRYSLLCEKSAFLNRINEYLTGSNKDYACCIGCEYFEIREDKYYCWKGAKNPYGILGSGFSTFSAKEKCDKEKNRKEV